MSTKVEPKLESAVLAGGCFWCLEAAYQMVQGVASVTSGYTGGHVPDPSYEQVSSGTTGHAEAVHIEFDPKIISYRELLDIFWVIHDPTTPNRQGNDIGPQYRSAIFYANTEQHSLATASRDQAQTFLSDAIVTEVTPLAHFYPAEAYHQNYFRNHPDQAYCQLVINPKLRKLKQHFNRQLKEKI